MVVGRRTDAAILLQYTVDHADEVLATSQTFSLHVHEKNMAVRFKPISHTSYDSIFQSLLKFHVKRS